MPNIVANRINNQHDFKGMGFSVFCEELSGDCALKIAIKYSKTEYREYIIIQITA
jgi:hypothetical protein